MTQVRPVAKALEILPPILRG